MDPNSEVETKEFWVWEGPGVWFFYEDSLGLFWKGTFQHRRGKKTLRFFLQFFPWANQLAQHNQHIISSKFTQLMAQTPPKLDFLSHLPEKGRTRSHPHGAAMLPLVAQLPSLFRQGRHEGEALGVPRGGLQKVCGERLKSLEEQRCFEFPKDLGVKMGGWKLGLIIVKPSNKTFKVVYDRSLQYLKSFGHTF